MMYNNKALVKSLYLGLLLGATNLGAEPPIVREYFRPTNVFVTKVPDVGDKVLVTSPTERDVTVEAFRGAVQAVYEKFLGPKETREILDSPDVTDSAMGPLKDHPVYDVLTGGVNSEGVTNEQLDDFRDKYTRLMENLNKKYEGKRDSDGIHQLRETLTDLLPEGHPQVEAMKAVGDASLEALAACQDSEAAARIENIRENFERLKSYSPLERLNQMQRQPGYFLGLPKLDAIHSDIVANTPCYALVTGALTLRNLAKSYGLNKAKEVLKELFTTIQKLMNATNLRMNPEIVPKGIDSLASLIELQEQYKEKQDSTRQPKSKPKSSGRSSYEPREPRLRSRVLRPRSKQPKNNKSWEKHWSKIEIDKEGCVNGKRGGVNSEGEQYYEEKTVCPRPSVSDNSDASPDKENTISLDISR